jgi:hypothetical protein
MRKSSWPLRAALVCLAVLSAACATTRFQSTWTAPGARPIRFSGRKVMAVFVTRNQSVRRRAEDALARELTARGAEGVPSYTFMSAEEARNEEAAKAKVERLGFAGSVVMRLAGRETEVSYQPGVVWSRPYYRRFWGGYWGWGWGHVWEPGYLRADEYVKVETLVYDASQDELVWAGVSSTLNPNRVEGLVSELAGAVTKELEKAGLFAKS